MVLNGSYNFVFFLVPAPLARTQMAPVKLGRGGAWVLQTPLLARTSIWEWQAPLCSRTGASLEHGLQHAFVSTLDPEQGKGLNPCELPENPPTFLEEQRA